MEGAEEMEYLLALLLILLPKADFALLVSLDELGATLDLALVVASLQLVALDRLLAYIRESYKLVHEHIEHRIIMTPVAVLQPEPLEGILLLHGNEALSQGIDVDALCHLLLDEGNETFGVISSSTSWVMLLPAMLMRQR